jgi:peroxiredoxin
MSYSRDQPRLASLLKSGVPQTLDAVTFAPPVAAGSRARSLATPLAVAAVLVMVAASYLAIRHSVSRSSPASPTAGSVLYLGPITQTVSLAGGALLLKPPTTRTPGTTEPLSWQQAYARCAHHACRIGDDGHISLALAMVNNALTYVLVSHQDACRAAGGPPLAPGKLPSTSSAPAPVASSPCVVVQLIDARTGQVGDAYWGPEGMMPDLTGPRPSGTGITSDDARPYAQSPKKVELIPVADRKTAGAMKGTLMTGATYKLSSDLGQVVVLSYFASWCPPCQTETPKFDSVYRARKGNGVTFVGVDAKDSGKDGTAWIEAKGISFPVLNDPNGQTALELDGLPIVTLPTTVLIDKHGALAAIYQTPLLPSDLNTLLDKLKNET